MEQKGARGNFQLLVGQFLMECPSPIIVHRCLWEPKEQEQGIRGTTLRAASDWRCSRSWRKSSGAVISAQHPRTPQGPTSPCAAAPARHVRLISSRYSKPILGGSPDPPPDTPSSHQSPNCRSNFQTVTCANQPGCPGPFGRGAICLAI